MTQPNPPQRIEVSEVPAPMTAHTSEAEVIEGAPEPSVYSQEPAPHTETPEEKQ